MDCTECIHWFDETCFNKDCLEFHKAKAAKKAEKAKSLADKEAARELCSWNYKNGDQQYSTACENSWQMNKALYSNELTQLRDSIFKYCPFCGRPLVIRIGK